MKIIALLLAIIATCLIAADSEKQPAGPNGPEVSYVTATSLAGWANYLPTYHRLNVNNWMEIKGRQVENGQSVSLAGPQQTFDAGITVIETRKEPTVIKRSDGTWQITFQ